MKLTNDLYRAVGEAVLKLNSHSIINKNGEYILFSDAVISGFGYQYSDMEGRNITEFIYKDDVTALITQLSYLPGDKSATLPAFRFHIKNDNYRWLELTATNLLDNPHIKGFLIQTKDVTEAVEADKTRNKVITSHANFFAKHPFGIAHLTMTGVVDMINPQLTEDLGYRLVNIAERGLTSFFLPQYRRKVLRMYYKANTCGKAETFDVQIFNIKGESIFVNLTIVPVVYQGETLEIYIVVKDISERKALQENLKKLSIVADKTKNGVVITDKNGIIEWVNNGFSQINGYTLEEAIGKETGILLKTNPPNSHKEEMYKELNQGRRYVKEMLCYRKDGSTYWNLVEVSPVMNEQNQLERRISIHTDITERKNAEAELKRFAEDLYKRNKELQQFGYIVSHNLRTPVANIMGLTELIELEKEDAETVEHCTREIKNSIHRLDNVIRDLSDILSLTDGSKPITKEQIDLVDLLIHVKTDLKEVIECTGSFINIKAKKCTIHSHNAYLYSIFYNLISNAIKYRSDDPPFINIDITPQDDNVIIKVADNGVGIDLDRYEDEVFKPYKRFSSAAEGKGLGLFLVKSHVEALGGNIDLNSMPGKGTTFTITLPITTQTKITSKNEFDLVGK